MTIRAYVFDAYGTLFDVHAAIQRHRGAAGADADRLSETWRAKQLEYTWTLTLMGRYEDFWTLTERALDFALARFPSVDKRLRPDLLSAYRKLDAFPDAREALTELKARGFATAILSNGAPAMLTSAVKAADLGAVLDYVLSVDAIRIYKPRREVYELAARALGCAADEIAFVSSNRWDAAGAAAAGMRPLWVNRAATPAEYDELPPAATLKDLSSLVELRL
jgi:2-haloacid dehalogenase